MLDPLRSLSKNGSFSGKPFLSQNISGLYGTPLLVDNENYIDAEVGFNFCVIENGANFEVQAVYKADTSCMLKLDDSSVVDDTGC